MPTTLSWLLPPESQHHHSAQQLMLSYYSDATMLLDEPNNNNIKTVDGAVFNLTHDTESITLSLLCNSTYSIDLYASSCGHELVIQYQSTSQQLDIKALHTCQEKVSKHETYTLHTHARTHAHTHTRTHQGNIGGAPPPSPPKFLDPPLHTHTHHSSHLPK